MGIAFVSRGEHGEGHPLFHSLHALSVSLSEKKQVRAFEK